MSAAAATAGRETTLAAARDVEGWLTDAQARRLWDAAAGVGPDGQIVEIGSFRGRSTIVLASAAPAGVTVTAIDPHLGGDRGPQELHDVPSRGAADHAAFLTNLERNGVSARVRHVRLRSAQALGNVEGQVTLLYVDGAHRIRPAGGDLRRWGARVAPGGGLLVHDAFSSIGVTVALFAHVIGREGWRYRGRDGSLAEYRRGPALTGAQRAAELGHGLAQLPWFVRNLAVKALLVADQPAAARLLGAPIGTVALLTPTDLAAFLVGEWSVSRQINGDADAFIGVARFVAEGEGLRWHETGRLRLGAYMGAANRTYRIVPAAGAWEVRFEDGRPFHALDLGDGHCEADHLCGPDLYRGRYVIEGPDRLTVAWRVTGPGRADTIASDYRRAARMSASTRTSA